MEKPFVIGLVGGATSGKSTLAEELAKKLWGYKVGVVSIATPLKEGAKELQKMHAEAAWAKSPDQLKKSFRPVWVAAGKAIRAEDPDYFINKALRDAESREYRIVILDDVRYENEWRKCHFTIEVSPARSSKRHWSLFGLKRKWVNCEEKRSISALLGRCDYKFISFKDELRTIQLDEVDFLVHMKLSDINDVEEVI